MATERQIQIPGGSYINETTNQKELQIPGAQYINEDTSSNILPQQLTFHPFNGV